MSGYTFTDHILCRMEERCITPAEIAETLLSGSRQFLFPDGSVKYMHKGINLILKGNDRLVTVYRATRYHMDKNEKNRRSARISLRQKKEALRRAEDMNAIHGQNRRQFSAT